MVRSNALVVEELLSIKLFANVGGNREEDLHGVEERHAVVVCQVPDLSPNVLARHLDPPGCDYVPFLAILLDHQVVDRPRLVEIDCSRRA